MNWNDTDIGFQPITNHSIFVELTLIKNDGRDWTHFEMPIWHFILVKWVCISQAKLNLLTKALVLLCHILCVNNV